MVTEKVIEEVTNAVQREAGKNNLVLGVGAIGSGYAIRLSKTDDGSGAADLFYRDGSGDIATYDTAKDAYDAMLREKVEPYQDPDTGKYEMPRIVYVQNIVVVTEEEVR